MLVLLLQSREERQVLVGQIDLGLWRILELQAHHLQDEQLLQFPFFLIEEEHILLCIVVV